MSNLLCHNGRQVKRYVDWPQMGQAACTKLMGLPLGAKAAGAELVNGALDGNCDSC